MTEFRNVLLVLLVCAALARGGEDLRPVYDVPRLNDIVVDGKSDDWGASGFRVDTLVQLNGTPLAVEDCDGRARLAWSDRGLLMLIAAQDNKWMEAEKKELLWMADGIEAYMSPRVENPNVCQWLIAPGMATDQPTLRWNLHDHRKDEELKGKPAELIVARQKKGNACVMEVLFPWSAIGVIPAPGHELGFTFWINDRDTESQPDSNRIVWYPGTGVFMAPQKMHALRLSDKQSPPMDARIVGENNIRTLKTELRITARPDLKGKKAVVRQKHSNKSLAEPVLSEAVGGYSVAKVRLPLAPEKEPYGRVQLAIDGRVCDEFVLPETGDLPKRAWHSAEIVMAPFVFVGQQFPQAEFKQPVYVDQLVGSCDFDIKYYDTKYDEVTAAEELGRYAAVVRVTPESGDTREAIFTICRIPSRVRWWRADVEAGFTFPEALGVSADISRTRVVANGMVMKSVVPDLLADSEEMAIMLAGQREARPGEKDVERNGWTRKNARWIHGLRKKLGIHEPYPYWVHIPDAASNAPGKVFPTILFLHGGGGRNDTGKVEHFTGPPQIVEYARKNDAIVIGPRCANDSWWSMTMLKDLLDDVCDTYPVDPQRLYLTGLSMGGYGSWQLVAAHPELFAAAIPICGGGDPRDVSRHEHVPTWVFHGDEDPTVPVEQSREMVEALKKVGADVEYTEYKGVGHNSWSPTYRNPKLYEWLFSQKKQAK